MLTLSHTRPVNENGETLSRDQLWLGLVLKAENPVPFLAAMSACEIVDRGENWLLRNITLRGEEMQERVTFEPEERVLFVRTKGSALGSILNEIVETDAGDLALRFTFNLTVDGLEDGSPEEAAFADRMSQSYFAGVDSTLAEIRRRVAAGLD